MLNGFQGTVVNRALSSLNGNFKWRDKEGENVKKRRKKVRKRGRKVYVGIMLETRGLNVQQGRRKEETM